MGEGRVRRLAALVCLFALLALVAGCPRRGNDAAHGAGASANLTAELAALLAPRASASSTAPPVQPGVVRLRVVFLDVGQGDAALLQTADGHTGMIDTGPPEARDKVLSTLASLGVQRLDWLLLSHPHTDHIGNAQRVLERVPVGRIYDPGFAHPIATYDRLLQFIGAQRLPYSPVRQGQRLDLGPLAQVEVLQPHEPFIDRTRSDVNANSVVVRVTAGNVRILFTGDAEWETERRLLDENYRELQSDVLKVAHHGSRYATTTEFLMAVQPRHAVISCAAGNEYGHPGAPTLTNLTGRQVQFFRTDLQGDVTMMTDGAQVSFMVARQVAPAALLAPGGRERSRGE